MYCKVAEGGSPAAELSSKAHHWGTCFYLGLIIAKASKISSHFWTDKSQSEIQNKFVAIALPKTLPKNPIL